MSGTQIQPLGLDEMRQTIGGDRDWGDFLEGLAAALGLGCAWTGHPVVCIGTAIAGGASLYL